MNRISIALAAALAASQASASQWWWFDWPNPDQPRPACVIAHQYPSPAARYEQAQNDAQNPRIVDNGDEVDVVSDLGKTHFFRTKEACNRAADEELKKELERRKIEDEERKSLDQYR